MSEFSRRVFLKGGTAAIVAAGAISAVPGLPALLGRGRHAGPRRRRRRRVGRGGYRTSGSLGEPVVAHIRDLSVRGDRALLGHREITVHDPGLAASILRALR